MRAFLFGFTLLFSTHLSAQSSGHSVELLVEPGVWPNELNSVSAGDQRKSLVFSSRHIVVEKRWIEPTTVVINKNTVLYVPSQATVRAKPKVYTHPELAEEVKMFYNQGVGNYAFWATLIGIAAAIQ